LLALIDSVKGKRDWFATLDVRLKPFAESVEAGRVKWVSPTLWHRLISEYWLRRRVLIDDVLLCFGNLPPLFRCRGRVIVFVQNRYLVEALSLRGNSLRVRSRLFLERWWLSQFSKNVDLFVVQTPTMKSLIQSRIAQAKSVAVLPFAASNEGYVRSVPSRNASGSTYDFLCVASGEPHKNHKTLIEAWCLLAQDGLFPTLCVTVDPLAFPEICRFLQQKKTDFGLKIENCGSISYEHIRLLYGQSKAFIFVSLFESLGLPLIEARQAGLPILAPELDYVRDVLDPDQVFDPGSPISIARAVKRFLGSEEQPLLLLDAEGFLNQILHGSE
jgi:glycosyltransferase involved in cell wall biosynthesis